MKSNLYTGGGDSGTTSLVGGQRVSKTDIRLEAYGTLDEFSSFLSLVMCSSGTPEELKGQLEQIQNKLFDVGCYLATAVESGAEPSCNAVCDKEISVLEGWIDALDGQTPKIKAFVLPGGCMAAAHCHVARTVCRRAERRILALSEVSYVDPNLLRWINRLSDYLFIASRWLNSCTSTPEVVWKKYEE